MSWPTTRLRYVADLNPAVRSDLLAAQDTEVSFLPMEAIGEDGSLNLDRVRPVVEVRNGYSYFEDGDVAFAKVTPCFENGKGAVMRDLQFGAGFGTSELTVLRPKGDASARFLNYVVQSEQFRQNGAGAMTGAGGLRRVPDDFTRDFKTPWPSHVEQVHIADFLDEQTAHIDTLLAEKESLKGAVHAYFAARVGTAVVEGLEAGGPLVGAEGKGFDAVRSDWDLVPLKHLVSFAGGMTPSKDNALFWDGEIPWVSPKDMKRFVLFDSEDHVSQLALDSTSLKLQSPESVLVVVRGMILAHTFPVALNAVEVSINQDMKAMRPNARISSRYLAWALRGLQPLMLSLTEESAHGTKVLRTDQWANQPIPVPSESEQRELVSKFELWERQTSQLTTHLTQHIDRLREYRSSLISAAVTGQLDISTFELKEAA